MKNCKSMLWGLAHAFATQKRVPCPSRVLCERAGFLADIAAADHRIHPRLLTTTRCPARFNLDRRRVAQAFVDGIEPVGAPPFSWAARLSVTEHYFLGRRRHRGRTSRPTQPDLSVPQGVLSLTTRVVSDNLLQDRLSTR